MHLSRYLPPRYVVAAVMACISACAVGSFNVSVRLCALAIILLLHTTTAPTGTSPLALPFSASARASCVSPAARRYRRSSAPKESESPCPGHAKAVHRWAPSVAQLRTRRVSVPLQTTDVAEPLYAAPTSPQHRTSPQHSTDAVGRTVGKSCGVPCGHRCLQAAGWS